MTLPSPSRRSTVVVAVVAVIGVTLRLVVMAFGSNFDYDSYEVVGRLQAEGENVYAWTGRYNYGPVWFILLGWLWNASAVLVGDAGLYRLFIVLVLIAADLGVGFMLLHRFGPRAGAFFILSPLSVFITGYHNQFDNLAIAVGLAAVLVLGEARGGPITRRQLSGLALLSLSIATKHLLFFLPLWLAFRQAGWQRRSAYVLMPVGLFAASFLPWAYDGWSGIYDNVISHRSFANAPLVNALTVGTLDAQGLATLGSVVFFAAMVGGGWLTRRLPGVSAMMVMLVALVILAPGMANQHLAIPVAAMAVAPGTWFGLYTVAATVFLIGDSDGLGFEGWVLPMFDRGVVGRAHIYDVLVLLLAIGGVQWWRRELSAGAVRAPQPDAVAAAT